MKLESAWLTARQNADGGWPYLGGGSAAEPTAWALLALHSVSAGSPAVFERGLGWLGALQRRDGGWPPRPNVQQSTWVTALPLLLPDAAIGKGRVDAGIGWLLAQSGRESSWLEQLRMFLMTGGGGESYTSHDGWPWFSGAAAWVVPTSLAILALRRLKPASDPRVASRVRSGADFLLARRCADGGWNHGATKALGYESGSYPETTGVALLALAGERGERAAGLGPSLATARRHLAETPSREAASWLQLGLTAHGQPAARREFSGEPRHVLDGALSILAELALNGRNVFTA
jgi:hypothetical protein